MSDISMVRTSILDKLLQLLNENAGFLDSQSIQAAKDMAAAPGRMESRYDSSKTELGYLADSFNLRLAALKQDISTIERLKQENIEGSDSCQNVCIGSIFQLDRAGKKDFYFLLPTCGGIHLNIEGLGEITTISPDSPLAKALMGKRRGTEIQLKSGKVMLISVF